MELDAGGGGGHGGGIDDGDLTLERYSSIWSKHEWQDRLRAPCYMFEAGGSCLKAETVNDVAVGCTRLLVAAFALKRTSTR